MHAPVRETIEPTVPSRATWREWVGLGVLVLPALLIAIDMTVLFLAAPRLAADLNPSSTELLWILDIYGFFLAGSLVTMGALGDRIGRRKLLLLGAVAFSVTSVIAAYATSPAMLIGARALLGIAAATLMPSTLSLIRNMFHDEQQRGVAIAVWATMMMGGAAAGPVLGGLVLEHFWWGAVFLLNVPFMVLLLAAAPVLLPEYKPEKAGRLDIASAAMATIAVMAVVYGVKHMAAYRLDWNAAAAMLGGVLIGALFVRRQNQLADPMINPELFRNSAFRAILTTQSLIVLAVAGPFFLANQYLQLVLGLSPLKAGLALLPALGAGMAGSLLAPWVANRIRPAYVIGGGLLLSTVGLLIMTQSPVNDGYLIIMTGFSITVIGGHSAITLLTNAVLGAAPPERAGEASGLSETSLELAHALGIALVGSAATAVYRDVIGKSLPASLPAEVLNAARESLYSAVTAAGKLPAEKAAQLLLPSREAFMSGLQVAATGGALVMAALALLAVTLLRNATAGAATSAGH